MKLSLVLAFVFWGFPTLSHGVNVFEDFLSGQECEEIIKQAEGSLPSLEVSSTPISRSKIAVNNDIKKRLAQSMAFLMSECAYGDEACFINSDAKSLSELHDSNNVHLTDEIYMSYVTNTTLPHQDHRANPATGDRELVSNDYRVGFVMLDDHKSAFFRHGDNRVPVKKGNFLMFEGAVEHNTVVPDTHEDQPIRYLGPFILTGRGFSAVGGVTFSPAPTLRPTARPSLRPSIDADNAWAGTDACAEDCDKPAVINMKYTGDHVIQNAQGSDKSFVTGTVDGATTVHIVASDKEDGSGEKYFEGEVNIGDIFAIDGSAEGKLNSNTYIIIKDANGNLLQMVGIHASCSVPIVLGDRFGSLDLVGYQDKNQCGAGDSATIDNASSGSDACAGNCEKPAVINMKYTGDHVIQNAQGSGKSFVTGTVNGATTVHIVASDKEDGSGEKYFEGEVNIGDIFAIDGSAEGKLNSNTYIIIKDTNGNLLQMVGIHASCSVPIVLGDRFGSLDLVGYQDKNQCGAGDSATIDNASSGSDACAGNCEKPAVINMKYTGDHVIQNAQGSGKSFVTGTVNGATTVHIVASDKEDGSGEKYFEGEVNIGDIFAIDGSAEGKLNSNTYIIIKDANGNLLQMVGIHASCSVPIVLGDRFGSLDLVGYQDKNQCGAGDSATIVQSSTDNASSGSDACAGNCEKPAVINMKYTGDHVIQNAQGSDKSFVTGTVNGATTVHIVASDKEDGSGEKYFEGEVNIGDIFAIDGSAKDKLNSNTYIIIKDANGNLLQMVGIHASCSVPIVLGDRFGSLDLVGYQDKNQCGAGDSATIVQSSTDNASSGSDACAGNCEKPAVINMKYTGDHVIQNAQGSDKSFVTGTVNGATTVRIVASDKEDGSGEKYFEGEVNIGDIFAIDGSAEGKLNSNTYILIKDTNGNLLQTVGFHASCSVPIVLGDHFGSLDLVGYQDKNGCGAGEESNVQVGSNSLVDLCESHCDSPSIINMLYTSEMVESHSQGDKAKVSGDVQGAPTVEIIASKKEDGSKDIYFQGEVGVDHVFAIDGGDKLPSTVFVIIKDVNTGNTLQLVEFHASCSVPIHLGDRFGSVDLVGYEDEDGCGFLQR